MPTPTDPADAFSGRNTYFIDPDQVTEMARLYDQDRLITASMGGLIAEQADVSPVHDILDIACGPGGWCLGLAEKYLDKLVLGIDISEVMITYARTQAEALGLSNATFRLMNALGPLDFPDSAFDLVNGRFLVSFMPRDSWKGLLGECLRLLRPGGVIRMTEADAASIAYSPATIELGRMITRALFLTGKGFSEDGSSGISAVLERLLQEAGVQHVKGIAHAVNISAGTEAHRGYTHNFLVALKGLQPFLLKSGVLNQKRYTQLFHQVQQEMHADTFRGVWYLFTAYGSKET